MRYFNILVIISLTFISSSICGDESSYQKLDFKFEDTVEYKIVNVFKTMVSEDKNYKMNVSKNSIGITTASETCKFESPMALTDGLKLVLSDPKTEESSCDGNMTDLISSLKGLISADNNYGYAMRFKAFNSDWVVLGADNKASSDGVNIVAGQRYLQPDRLDKEHKAQIATAKEKTG